ncbi:MAG: hypothetical protein IJD39_03510 [Clostridia bacterium]|nr:hypothetical protein [Clostridia bacterium]
MREFSKAELQALYEPLPPEACNRIQDTLALLPLQKEEPIMKRRISIGLLAALIAILGLTSAALAGGILGRIQINWKGEKIIAAPQITQAPYHTNSPSALEEQHQMQSISQRIDALANEFPSRDLIVSTWKDQGAATISYRGRSMITDTLDQFLAFMEKAPHLPPLHILPEGYTFQKAEIYLACQEGSQYTLAETRETEGITLQRYTADPKDDVITGYHLILEKEDGQRIMIYCHLYTQSDLNDLCADLAEDSIVEMMDAPGMDNALRIVTNDRAGHILRKELDAPIPCLNEFIFSTEQVEIRPTLYQEVQFHNSAPLEDEQALFMLLGIAP